MDEEIPVEGEVAYSKWLPPIKYRMSFWESAISDVEYMGRTTVKVRGLPFSYESPPAPVTEEHLLYMKDRYGFDYSNYRDDPDSGGDTYGRPRP